MKKIILISVCCLLFAIAALAQNATVKLTYNRRIEDYGPIIKNALDQLAAKGGGTLIIPYGEYPILTSVLFENHQPGLEINLSGQKSKTGQLPVFIQKDRSRKPTTFFWFKGNINNPELTINVSNIQITGNNFPYYPGHPFYLNGASPGPAFACSNILTAHFFNVIIMNVYGDGIALMNGFDNSQKKYRIESPTIKNCKVLNCWSWNGKNDRGDGIMLWQVNKPLIEGCQIINNINVTKHYGRCGIVLEHNTEKAIIRNCTIAGYERNLHIECDYGGHVINNNIFSQSKIGIVFSEDCSQDPNKRSWYFPTLIQKNTFEYNNEFENNNLVRNDFGFISIHKNSFTLDGLRVINNKFKSPKANSKLQSKVTKDKQFIKTDQKVFMRLDNQNNVTESGNIFE